MFRSLQYSERKNLLGVVENCIPHEETNFDESWKYDLLAGLRAVLYLEEKDLDKTTPNTKYGPDTMFQCTQYTAIELYTLLLIYVVELKLFDSQGSILLRNLLHRFQLSDSDGIWLSNQLSTVLLSKHKEFLHIKENKNQTLRYAKIGAVAVGAGALLLFTAGLAAPALAGGLVVMGISSAAAVGIASSMVLIFGGTAAGLAGYRMKARTAGLTEFEFHQYEEKDRMEVIIMVSGWMEEDEDDKRTFGVIPSDENIGLKERLTRYYRQHDPDRLSKVSNEAKCFEDDPYTLFEQMLQQYGANPEELESLMPSLPLPPARRGTGTNNNSSNNNNDNATTASTSTSSSSSAAAAGGRAAQESNPYMDLIVSGYEKLAASVDLVPTSEKPEKSSLGPKDYSSIDFKPLVDPSVYRTKKASHRSADVDSFQDEEVGSEDSESSCSSSEGDGSLGPDDDLPVATLVTPSVSDQQAQQLPDVQAEALNAELIESEQRADIHMEDNFPYW